MNSISWAEALALIAIVALGVISLCTKEKRR